MVHRGFLKVDIAAHILPPRYKKTLDEAFPGHIQQDINERVRGLWDLDERFRIMDRYEVMHVLTLSRPPLEEVVEDPKRAIELAKMANDEIAELVFKYPDRFPAGVATVVLTDVDASLKELERAIRDLNLRGVQVYTNVRGRPLDSPEFEPLWEVMAKFDLPIWIHPTHGVTQVDYVSEGTSKHSSVSLFGWPYETTLAMTRLVFSGVFDKWPQIKFITHHAGGMVPYFQERITAFHDFHEMVMGATYMKGLRRRIIDYYKGFYADTALYGNPKALDLAIEFFGIDKVLFGTDFPFCGENGGRVTRQTIWAIESLELDWKVKVSLYYENARRLLRLPI